MTRVCEKYRERALQDGLNSKAGEIWRTHSRNCPRCRTEIYLLSMLGESVADSRQHISRRDYERLLAEVHEHSGRNHSLMHRMRRYWNFHFISQVAAVLCVFSVVAFSGTWSRSEFWDEDDFGRTVISTGKPLSAAALEEQLYDFGAFVAGAMPGVFSSSQDDPVEESALLKDAPVWDSSVERAFFELRNDIEDQCLFYSGMIDRELQE